MPIYPTSSISSRRLNFDFAFDDSNFSDRVLHIVVMDDSFSTVVKEKALHISSPILAANSPFFRKLFENGMRESQQSDATLTISASEETGVMELLSFMYCNTLKETSTSDLLGVLMVADKFETIDCVRYCSEMLREVPVSLESALWYLGLPSSVWMYEEVKPLIDAAKKYLLAHYKDINKVKEDEAMTLPLYAIEILLGSDQLRVGLSGDDVFELILKYARAQYPELDKRREILAKNLTQFIPFRHMSSSKLKQALVCPDLDHGQVAGCIAEAFIRVVGKPVGQSSKYPVVKVEQYGTPRPRCVVFFDLKKEDCKNLFTSRHLASQCFCLGGRWFCLIAECFMKEVRRSFALFLKITKESQRCSVEFEFEAMKKSSLKFENKRKSPAPAQHSDLLLGHGYSNLFNMQWADFMSDDCDYFIDGILHLRADLTIRD